MNNKIAFRVDGGAGIGMGHVMRCLALAKAFPEDVDIKFIVKKNNSVLDLLKEYKYQAIIDTNLSYKEEIEVVKDIVIDNKIDILIADSYKIEQDYLIELKKVVNKLVSIHDFAPFSFPSDIVINGNVYASNLDYNGLDNNTEFLLGTKYTLMREEFRGLEKKEVDKKVKRLLITVGGSDPLNLTPKIIESLIILEKKIKNELYIDIIVGPSFNNVDKIIEKTKGSGLEIALHFNIKKMSKLMLQNDLAITAGGSTLYELAATGTPAIVLLQAENQLLAAKEMAKLGTIINLGFWNKTKKDKLANNLIKLINKRDLRYKMSRKAQSIVDGKGVERCIQKILSY